MTKDKMFCGEDIKKSQKWLNQAFPSIEAKSQLFSLGSDPTRLKILFLLKHHRELCVTDLAQILKISLSAVSHQLNLLEKAQLVAKVREGKIVCYSLKQKSRAQLARLF